MSFSGIFLPPERLCSSGEFLRDSFESLFVVSSAGVLSLAVLPVFLEDSFPSDCDSAGLFSVGSFLESSLPSDSAGLPSVGLPSFTQ